MTKQITHLNGKYRPDKTRLWVARLAEKGMRRPTLSAFGNVYILPTQKGVYFLITLIIMFLWSVNYALSLGYALTFFAATLGLIAAFLTTDNLHKIKVLALESDNVFAGEPAYFRLLLKNLSQSTKVAITARRDGFYAEAVSVLPMHDVTCLVPVHELARGRKTLSYVQISTEYPIGIFRSWSWLRFDAQLLIYPSPDGHLPLPFLPEHHGFDEGVAYLDGAEDFHDLRDYQAGDNLKNVLWRKLINNEVRVKTFKDFSGQQCILDFDDPHMAELETEARLSQLCAWVLYADEKHIPFALHLPNKRIAMGVGRAHRDRCLEALACY